MSVSNTFCRIVKDCSTCKDGESYDFAGLGAVIGVPFCCAFAVYGLIEIPVKDLDFTVLGNFMKDFAMALSIIVGGCAIGKGCKSHTEPDQ